MGPFTPLFSFGVPVAVMCCKIFPQKNMCCLGSLSPFKKSAMSEIYLLSGSSSSFVFFLLILSTLSLLLRLWGWERWLFDSTFLLWTDYDDRCFAGCFSVTFSGTTLAQEALLRLRLHGVASPGGFGFVFLFLVFPCSWVFRHKRRFCSVFVSAFPCLVFSPSGWVGVCLVFRPFLLPFPPPPAVSCALHLL